MANRKEIKSTRNLTNNKKPLWAQERVWSRDEPGGRYWLRLTGKRYRKSAKGASPLHGLYCLVRSAADGQSVISTHCCGEVYPQFVRHCLFAPVCWSGLSSRLILEAMYLALLDLKQPQVSDNFGYLERCNYSRLLVMKTVCMLCRGSFSFSWSQVAILCARR